MTVGSRLFVSSAIFGIVIAGAYWLVAREPTGTLLLGFLAFGLSFAAGYMIVVEREADLWGDDPDAQIADGSGEVVGTFSIRSPLPIATAAAITVIGLGLVVSPTMTALGIIATLILGTFFILQSA